MESGNFCYCCFQSFLLKQRSDSAAVRLLPKKERHHLRSEKEGERLIR